MFLSGPKIHIPLQNGGNLHLQVTDLFSLEKKLEIVANGDFVNGTASVHRADFITLDGWSKKGPETFPSLTIYMDGNKDRKFCLAPSPDGTLGNWLHECCNFSGVTEAYYTPKPKEFFYK